MEKMTAHELMVPADRFPKISDSATFYEALAALESAQENFLSGKSTQRILLVENPAGKIIGKISPIDLFRGLEPNYGHVNIEETIKRLGVQYLWKAMQEDMRLWENPFRDLCRKAGDIRIKDFIQPPGEGQSTLAEDPLAKCLHRFVVGRHDALFVLKKTDIVGLLRFSDLYKTVSKTMKACTV